MNHINKLENIKIRSFLKWVAFLLNASIISFALFMEGRILINFSWSSWFWLLQKAFDSMNDFFILIDELIPVVVLVFPFFWMHLIFKNKIKLTSFSHAILILLLSAAPFLCILAWTIIPMVFSGKILGFIPVK